MPTSDELKAAVEEGIIDASQAERLTAFLNRRTAGDPWEMSALEARGMEDVRFVRGFHDIFIALGIVLLFVGFAIVASSTSFQTVIFALAAVLAWGLAEQLARVKRLVLPSIVLAVCFTLFSGAAVLSALTIAPVGLGDLPWDNLGLTATAAAMAGAVLFYLRFRLPFALGVVAGVALMFAVMALHQLIPDFARGHQTLIALTLGIFTFTAAMGFDLSDPKRQTLRADNAFWLHLLAAPLVVHSVLSSRILNGGSSDDLANAAIVVAMVAALAILALLVDRRALLVAGLGYLGTAIAAILRETSVETSTVLAITLIVLGAGVVLLGTGWQTARRGLLAITPLPQTLKNRLPTPAGQS